MRPRSERAKSGIARRSDSTRCRRVRFVYAHDSLGRIPTGRYVSQRLCRNHWPHLDRHASRRVRPPEQQRAGSAPTRTALWATSAGGDAGVDWLVQIRRCPSRSNLLRHSDFTVCTQCSVNASMFGARNVVECSHYWGAFVVLGVGVGSGDVGAACVLVRRCRQPLRRAPGACCALALVPLLTTTPPSRVVRTAACSACALGSLEMGDE